MRARKRGCAEASPFPGGLAVEAALAELTKLPMGSPQAVRLRSGAEKVMGHSGSLTRSPNRSRNKVTKQLSTIYAPFVTVRMLC